MISGRGPVTNMYETIIWASLSGAFLSVALGLIYRERVILLAGAVVVALSTILANIMPLSMGSSISPLVPVLRSNYWLVVHVMTIVASYGAFLIAWALGNIGLLYYILGKDKASAIKPITMFTYRAMQVGVLLLAAGTILGGWWAAESWGRFWGWDPKENGALLIVLWNALILHARWGGLAKERGMAALAVFGNIVTSWSWFGTNMLGVGLHSYGFIDSAVFWMFVFVASQLAVIAIGCLPLTMWRSFGATAATAPAAKPGRSGKRPVGASIATARS
jgi:ABC-type transport system involved in cytochrome c biogenesis permease subunit